MESAEITEHAMKSSETTEIAQNSTERQDSENAHKKANHFVRSFRNGSDNSTSRGGIRFFGLLKSFANALANGFGGSSVENSNSAQNQDHQDQQQHEETSKNMNPKMEMAIALYHCIESGQGWGPHRNLDTLRSACEVFCTPDATFDCQAGNLIRKILQKVAPNNHNHCI